MTQGLNQSGLNRLSAGAAPKTRKVARPAMPAVKKAAPRTSKPAAPQGDSPQTPPLSLAQFHADRAATQGNSRSRFLAYMAMNIEPKDMGTGTLQMMNKAADTGELHTAVNEGLKRYAVAQHNKRRNGFQ